MRKSCFFSSFFSFFFFPFSPSLFESYVKIRESLYCARGILDAGMASIPGQTPPNLSLRNGCSCVPEPGVTIEELLVVVGERVGFDNIVSASRMNKAVVVVF